MTSDMLSQEEINALLQGNSSDGADDKNNESGQEYSDDVSDYIDSMQQDALGEIGNISFGSAATTLSTLLNQKVDITTPTVSVIARNRLLEEFPKPHVSVQVEYTEGFEGENLLVIRTEDAKIIADLMLGGDGTQPSEELSEMHLSAVQEAMNQMMGSAATSMSTIFDKRVDISPPQIDVLDVQKEKGIPEEDILIKVSFKLKVGDLIDSNIMQLLPVPFAKELVNQLFNPGSSKQEEKNLEVQQEAVQQHVEKEETLTKQMPSRPTYEKPSVDVRQANFTELTAPSLNEQGVRNLDLLMDIPLNLTVELGRTQKSIKEILELSPGSVVELDKLAGEPVDILVNQKLVAKGEVVVIDENFGVRITKITSREERIRGLN